MAQDALILMGLSEAEYLQCILAIDYVFFYFIILRIKPKLKIIELSLNDYCFSYAMMIFEYLYINLNKYITQKKIWKYAKITRAFKKSTYYSFASNILYIIIFNKK